MKVHIPEKFDPGGDVVTQILREAKTIAVVGLSSNAMRASHGVAEYLKGAGYRIIPVNPNETEVLGEKAYGRLEDVPEPVDIVDVFRRAEEVPGVAESAIKIGAKALYHAAWQFFSDRWLNIAPRSLTEPLGTARSDAPNEDTGIRTVLDSIEMVQVREVGRQAREYLNAGFSGDRLLMEIGQSILRDDNGWNLVHVLRVVFDEWKFCDGHPARNQLLIGLSRWATDVRKRSGSQSAAQTALRFARGQTAVDLYES